MREGCHFFEYYRKRPTDGVNCFLKSTGHQTPVRNNQYNPVFGPRYCGMCFKRCVCLEFLFV